MDFPWKWYLKDLPAPTRGKVFSTFACGGGSSMGYKRAGYEVVGCVEIDPAINRIYCANLHPRHNYLMDLRAFNELKELPDELYRLDILDGSPPCFVAGTPVKVRGGYKPIEDVQIGDGVLTHMGRYRRVSATMCRKADKTIRIKVMGAPEIVTTPNHPFYVRTMKRSGKFGKRTFGDPVWKAAGELLIRKNSSNTTLEQDYVGIPINTEARIPEWDGVVYVHNIWGKSVIHERKRSLDISSCGFWRFVGRYMGDGWLRDDRKEVIVCCGKHDLRGLKDIIDGAGLRATINEERTTYRATVHSVELYAFMTRFGHGAANKRLTDDVLNLPKEQLAAFMDGYLGADGHLEKDTGVQRVTGVSRELTMGIAAAVAKVYRQPCTWLERRWQNCTIEGRQVHTNAAYDIAFRKEARRQQHFIADGDWLWVPFRKAERGGPAVVYNISVEEDESYTVANLSCHNCSTFSMAGKREAGWGVEKQFREGQAKQTLDDLFFVYLETVERLKPKVCVAENVTGLVKGNAKGYVNEIAARFRELGYAVQLFLLNAAFMEVPQRRERVFFVANRCGFPNLRLKFGYRPVRFGEIKSPQGDEIGGDVGEVNSLRRLLAKAKPGDKKLADIAQRERGKNIGFTTPLIWDGDVSPTVMAGNEIVRMPEARFCTMADYTAMGAFPQDYAFDLDGNDKKARSMCKYMVGMSVPPSMTAHIADEIWAQWLSREAGR